MLILLAGWCLWNVNLGDMILIIILSKIDIILRGPWIVHWLLLWYIIRILVSRSVQFHGKSIEQKRTYAYVHAFVRVCMGGCIGG